MGDRDDRMVGSKHIKMLGETEIFLKLTHLGEREIRSSGNEGRSRGPGGEQRRCWTNPRLLLLRLCEPLWPGVVSSTAAQNLRPGQAAGRNKGNVLVGLGSRKEASQLVRTSNGGEANHLGERTLSEWGLALPEHRGNSEPRNDLKCWARSIETLRGPAQAEKQTKIWKYRQDEIAEHITLWKGESHTENFRTTWGEEH